MKRKNELLKDELRPEYHFDYSKGIRGKYYQRLLKEGANVVVLDPDVAEAFHDSAAVNDVLRSFLKSHVLLDVHRRACIGRHVSALLHNSFFARTSSHDH